jgi:hypothetical protein
MPADFEPVKMIIANKVDMSEQRQVLKVVVGLGGANAEGLRGAVDKRAGCCSHKGPLH